MKVAKHGRCASQLLIRRRIASTAKGSTDYFGYDGQSEMYRLYRPSYPLSMLQVLNDKLPIEKSKRALAVDIACGSGQLTSVLSRSLNTDTPTYNEFGYGFQRVIGFDTSQKQLDQALMHSNAANIEYKLEDIGDCIPMESDSVNLVTIAQGLHWFNIPNLLNEITRIIKGNGDGMLAVLGYSAPRFEQYEKFQEEFGKFYVQTLGSYNYGIDGKHCYWNIDRKLLDFAFSDDSMFEMFDDASFERTFFFENKFMSEQELFGYFQSMSGYQTFLKENGIEYGEDGDPMNGLRKFIERIW